MKLIYLIAINFLGFLFMAVNKKRAVEHKWRISESALFAVGAIGGGLGSWLGMMVFKHKTKKWYFAIGMPVLIIVWVVFCYLCFL